MFLRLPFFFFFLFPLSRFPVRVSGLGALESCDILYPLVRGGCSILILHLSSFIPSLRLAFRVAFGVGNDLTYIPVYLIHPVVSYPVLSCCVLSCRVRSLNWGEVGVKLLRVTLNPRWIYRILAMRVDGSVCYMYVYMCMYVGICGYMWVCVAIYDCRVWGGKK